MRAVMLLAGTMMCLIACTSQRTVNEGGIYPWQDGTSTGVLHFHCTYTAPYCGGAEIDPSEYPRPMSWSGSFYLRKVVPDSSGKSAINDPSQRITATIRTGSDGHGYLQLPAGHYLLLDSDRVDRKRYNRLLKDFAKPKMHQDPIDKECLKRWLHGPFGVIKMTDGDTLSIDNPMRGQCPWYAIPCVVYTGPLPP